MLGHRLCQELPTSEMAIPVDGLPGWQPPLREFPVMALALPSRASQSTLAGLASRAEHA